MPERRAGSPAVDELHAHLHINGLPDRLPYRLGWFGLTGQAGLEERRGELENLHRRQRLRLDQKVELELVNLSLSELEALYRARLRIELEELEDSLAVVRTQADELSIAGLTLQSLEPEDLLACHARWPDWVPGR